MNNSIKYIHIKNKKSKLFHRWGLMGIAAVELFCGAGLMGEGFSRAGFDAVYAADLDVNAVASYNQNLKRKVAAARDVKEVKKDIQCDLIVAGPPCQGFSTLGKRDKKDARNKLSLLLLDWAKAPIHKPHRAFQEIPRQDATRCSAKQRGATRCNAGKRRATKKYAKKDRYRER